MLCSRYSITITRAGAVAFTFAYYVDFFIDTIVSIFIRCFDTYFGALSVVTSCLVSLLNNQNSEWPSFQFSNVFRS